jgi:hypothetical protein
MHDDPFQFWWHFSDTTFVPVDVRLWGHSGKHLLAAGISHFDPSGLQANAAPVALEATDHGSRLA